MYNDERMLRVCAAEEARGVVDIVVMTAETRDYRIKAILTSPAEFWNAFNFASEPIREGDRLLGRLDGWLLIYSTTFRTTSSCSAPEL